MKKTIIFVAFLISVILGAVILKLTSPPRPIGNYVNLLADIRKQGYIFLTPDQYFNGNFSQKVCIIVHCCDYSYVGALNLVKVENSDGIRSCFFLRPNQDYFEQSVSYFQELQDQSWEIGYEYDTLSRANNNQTLALELFDADLSYMRSFFNISVTTNHGDVQYNLSVDNSLIYDNKLWKQLGIHDLLKEWGSPTYMSDSNYQWHIPDKPWNNLFVLELHADYW